MSSQEEVDAFDQDITELTVNLLIKGDDINDLSPLSNLISISGYLNILDNPLLSNIDGLFNLTHVGNSLRIWDNISLTNIDGLSSLQSIGGRIWIENNDMLTNIDGLENLMSLDSELRIIDNDLLSNIDGLNNLTIIPGSCTIENNQALSNIDGLSGVSEMGSAILSIKNNNVLTNINGLIGFSSIHSLHITSNLTLENIDGLSNLTTIHNLLILSGNELLENIDGLSNLSSIGGISMSGNNSLRDIDGLTNLTSVEVDLFIQSHVKLQNIDGLSSVTSVGDRLLIRYNEELKNVDGFINLISVGSSINLFQNDRLNNLDGFSNLISVGGNFIIESNQSLSNCCAIKDLLDNQDVTIGGNITLENNNTGCETEQEVIDANCRDYLFGEIFYDKNQNKIKDQNEYGIKGIDITNEIGNQKYGSNQQGRFGLRGESGVTYLLSPELELDWQITTDSASYSFTFDPDNKPELIFGLFHNNPEPSCDISITSEFTRCNTEVQYYVNVYNDGFTTNRGEVHIELDPNVSLVSSSVELQEIEGKFVYYFDTLYPFQNLEFTMLLDMPTEQFTGEIINVAGEVFYDIENELVSQDSTDYQSIVLCSYDPNDKLVSPVGVKDQNYTLHNTELQYTVRFQNTGNAAAIDVTILDTLSEKLDLETFNVVSSSFPVNTSLSDRAVEFYFQDIWLIDSLTNEPESHGYVSYTIQPKTDLPEETEIENTAHIIFDFNPAIITNTTKNTMVENLPSCPTSVDDEDILSFSISPNPFQDRFDISIEHGQATTISLFDINGQLISSRKVSGSNHTLSLLAYPTGIYILKLKDLSGKSSTQKIVKI